MNTIDHLAPELRVRKDLDMRAGDTVRVHIKIVEKGKTRIQIFEGLVIARKHGREAGATFTVRKISNGVGVERIFPLYSPSIEKIEVVKRSVMRRSKLYFIRTKVARDIRRKMRNLMQFFSSSADLAPVVPDQEPELEQEVVTESVVENSSSTDTETPEVMETAEAEPEQKSDESSESQ